MLVGHYGAVLTNTIQQRLLALLRKGSGARTPRVPIYFQPPKELAWMQEAPVFIFYRTRSGSTEVFDILLPEGAAEKSAERFPEGVRYNARSDRYQKVGLLVLMRDGKSDEYVLCVESALFTNEYETLVREIELLVGRDVHKMGADPVTGRYVHDILTDSGKSA